MDKPTVPPLLKDPLNKPPFEYDCLTLIKSVDPLFTRRTVEFDWELLSHALGETEEDLSDRDYKALAALLHELLQWIVQGDKLRTIGRRAVALAWVVNSDTFKGEPARKHAKLARKIWHRKSPSAPAL